MSWPVQKKHSVMLILLCIVVVAAVMWSVRTDLPPVSYYIGMVLGGLMMLVLFSFVSARKAKAAKQDCISSRNLTPIFLAYLMLLSFVTIFAYFDLIFISYLIGVATGAAMGFVALAFAFRSNRPAAHAE